MAESGIISWPQGNPLWEFSYHLGDYSEPEGIALHNVRYKGRTVLYKASLPSLRVQYDGTCGPYKDPLTYNNATDQGGGRRVAVYDYSIFGFQILALESYHQIGSYRLRQRWTFLPDGTIIPRMFSAGLQCNHDHRHHVYWRFDFDINDARNDTIYEYNTTTPDIGYGPGWHRKRSEIARVKNPATNRRWAIMDREGNGYFVIPDAADGIADSFSQHDLWLTKYHANEDLHGNQGTPSSDGLDAYINFENTEDTDIVLWYCGHLAHEAHDGGDEWHATGPRLVPFRW